MHNNAMCPKCNDEGRIGVIFRRVCPDCGGFPEKLLKKKIENRPADLPPPPQGGTGASATNIYLSPEAHGCCVEDFRQ